MQKDQRQGLKGARIELAYGEDPNAEPALYTLGEGDAVAERMMADGQEGFTVKSGELITASGHRFYALMELDASSSYENWGCSVAVGRGEDFRILWQGDDDFDAWIAEAKAQDPDFEFFPYRYRYFDGSDSGRDHHVGDDGWSVAPGSPPPPPPDS